MQPDNNDQFLKDLFAGADIPQPDINRRKETINLAMAEFATAQKNAQSTQGNGFWARLIGKQPDKRSANMSFSNKKVIYGGLATACVALMVFGIAPTVIEKSANRAEQGASINSIAAHEVGALKADSAKARKEAVMERKDSAQFSAMDSVTSNVAGSVADSVVAPSSSIPMPSMQVAADSSSPASIDGDPLVDFRAKVEVAAAQQEFGRDKFKNVDENNIHQVAVDPISTFSIDVDTASYSYMRSSLNQGVLPQKDAVRVEELINYFDYDYPLPDKKDEPFSTTVILKSSPWSEGKQLLTVGIKGYDIPKTQLPNSNLVFLLDVSGSMNEPAKLPLLKQSISMLLDTLKPTDTVAIVVYAGAAGTVLPPTKVADKMAIINAIQTLQPGGGTAGAEGIRQAYNLAEMNFDKNAVNRVILATDGDFNVGITNPEELKDFVAREKDKGIFLSVLGFGRGNYNDEMMQVLAQNGNGIAAYIDSLNEGRKVLVDEATKTLFPIAKDVKIQVEFNPNTVAEYRLVGYETRALKTEDFNNDKVDAGDIGAGSEVTAIYEITPKGGKTAVDASRYAPVDNAAKGDKSGELAFVKVRYKLPNEDDSKLITTPVTADMKADTKLTAETDWAVAVASFAQLLKGGTYTGKMTYDDVLRLAETSKGSDPFGYRAEFLNLVRSAKTASGLEAQPGNGGMVIMPAPVPVYQYPVPQER